MAANKTPPCLVGSGTVAARLLDDMPKAMLADLVVDMLRATYGESISDVELAARIAEAAGPVARVRGWRVPRWWREFLVTEER